jgi:hypothetical protein
MPNYTPTLGASRAFQITVKALGSHVWMGENFCHYTDLNGLMGILETNEFWLSDHRFLNDPSEHSYGEELAIRVISEYMQQEDDAEFSTLLKEVMMEIADASPVFYVSSFSKAHDRLDQWKGYGRTSEGVCLVLKNDVALGREGVLTQLPAIEPMQVIYNNAEQIHRLRTVISIFRDEFINHPCDVSRTFSLWKRDLSFLIAYQLIRFKHQEYSSEEEIRLVVSSKSPILAEKKTKHRVSNGRLIPYITTKNQSLSIEVKLPISDVIVGPLATQDSVIRSIEVFLQNMGYENVSVRGSSVPFRG